MFTFFLKSMKSPIHIQSPSVVLSSWKIHQLYIIHNYIYTHIYIYTPIIHNSPIHSNFRVSKYASVYTSSFVGGSVVHNLPVNGEASRDVGSIPGMGRSPGGGNGNPLEYSWKDKPVDRGEGYSPWDHKKSDTNEHTGADYTTLGTKGFSLQTFHFLKLK